MELIAFWTGTIEPIQYASLNLFQNSFFNTYVYKRWTNNRALLKGGQRPDF